MTALPASTVFFAMKANCIHGNSKLGPDGLCRPCVPGERYRIAPVRTWITPDSGSSVDCRT